MLIDVRVYNKIPREVSGEMVRVRLVKSELFRVLHGNEEDTNFLRKYFAYTGIPAGSGISLIPEEVTERDK